MTDGVIDKERAESATGISAKQVSRWRKRLRDIPKYRDALILAACRKADLVPAENHRRIIGAGHCRLRRISLFRVAAIAASRASPVRCRRQADRLRLRIAAAC